MCSKQSPPDSTVAVVGLGKIGLPLAAVFASNDYHVIGADINQDVVAAINQEKGPTHNEPGLDQLVSKARTHHTLSATTNTTQAVAWADIVVVIVPVLTGEENRVNYHTIDQAVESIAQGLQQDSLVIFETTLPPGDTANRFGEQIEKIAGLKPGKDFDLAYSPERVYANHIIRDLKQYPKVIGGFNEKSLRRATAFYRQTLGCDVREVSTLETAEFAKIAECIYRDVNIALANELAMFADKLPVNMSEVINASNSQPYAHIHAPGIGVGGHCIPVYPYFLINQGLSDGLAALSRQINDNMAAYAITQMSQYMGSWRHKRILILGLSYRGGVKEPTKSTTLKLIEQLKYLEAQPFVHDPLFSDAEISQYGATPFSWDSEQCEHIDGVMLQAFHKPYSELDFRCFPNCRVVLDGRNQLDKQAITRHGIAYVAIGNQGGDNLDPTAAHPNG